MGRWFRMYDEILDDPKVQKLSPADFKAWINLLCLSSRNDGRLPTIADIAFALRETEDAVSTVLERLLNGGLIERRSGGADGAHYAPNKWEERQYKSDTSTGRVKRFRERSKPVTETAPDTETDTETDKEEKIMPEKSGKYVFCGHTVKLTSSHFYSWKRLFRTIPDIEAELSTIDDWWQSQPKDKRENWFLATKGMLNKRHQENLCARQSYDRDRITV
jgi:hypothetical protein